MQINEYETIIEMLSSLKEDIVNSTNLIKESNEHIKEMDKQLIKHEERLNKHDREFEDVGVKLNKSKVNVDIMPYLGYIIAISTLIFALVK